MFTFLPDVPLSMVECGREPVRPREPILGVGRVSPAFLGVFLALE